MTREAINRRIDDFLLVRMAEALCGVAYSMPGFASSRDAAIVAATMGGQVRVRHPAGTPAAEYLVAALGDELLLSLQLNVFRFVVVYRVPATDGIDLASLAPRLDLWQRGAEHAGWAVGWREADDPPEFAQRYVEAYAYARAERRLLEDEMEELYWVNDIVQMTRAFMLEAHRCRIRLAPAAAGYVV